MTEEKKFKGLEDALVAAGAEMDAATTQAQDFAVETKFAEVLAALPKNARAYVGAQGSRRHPPPFPLYGWNTLDPVESQVATRMREELDRVGLAYLEKDSGIRGRKTIEIEHPDLRKWLEQRRKQ